MPRRRQYTVRRRRRRPKRLWSIMLHPIDEFFGKRIRTRTRKGSRRHAYSQTDARWLIWRGR